MGQQQTLLDQQGLKDAASKVLAQNAPSLLARFSQGHPVETPIGFQPGSAHELIIPSGKVSSPERPMNHFVDNNPYGYAAQAEQNYSREKHSNQFVDEYNDFPPRKAQENARLSFNERASSFATDINGGYSGGEHQPYQARPGLPPADMLDFSREGVSDDHRDARGRGDRDLGLVTNPNGLGEYADEYHRDVSTEYSARDHPYHANANVEGPYDDVPPTNPCLSQQPIPHQPPPFAYAAVNNAPACRVPSFPNSPERHQAQSSSQVSESTDRSSWKIGSIVEVYSDSAGSWHVSRVIGVNGENGADVLTVQFIAEDGSKQKSIYRNDQKIVSLGSRNGGHCELPPGFQQKASQSRPGQSVYLDATTGIKYSSADLAWTVHFERLAKQSSSVPDMTVANLRHANVSPQAAAAPMGTALVGEPPPQLSPQYHSPTQEYAPPSCGSDGQPGRQQAISLAQLMNMPSRPNHPHQQAQNQQQAFSQVSSFRSDMQDGMMPMHMSNPLSLGTAAPTDSGGKISLPSFDNNGSSNQAAYLRHEASYLQSLPENSLDYSREAEQYNGNLGSASHHPSVPRRDVAPAPAPVRSVNPQLQTWHEDPFSQWRR